MKTGRGYMVSDENIYNLYRKMSEAMGFKHPELFVTDPQRISPQAKQPPPNPDMIKIQAESQKDKAKLQLDGQKMTVDAKLQEMIAQIQAQAAIAVANLNNASKEKIAAMDLRAKGELAVFEANTEQQDQSKNQQMLTKSTELDVREIKVGYEEQILSLKKQVEQMADGHRNELNEQSVGRAEKHEEQVVDQVQVSLDAIAKAIAALGTVSAEAMKLNREAVSMMAKPQAIKVENIKTDSKGRITGADINKTIQ
jgi:hypothetical protein